MAEGLGSTRNELTAIHTPTDRGAFESFPKLPPEIRLKIWRFACCVPRNLFPNLTKMRYVALNLAEFDPDLGDIRKCLSTLWLSLEKIMLYISKPILSGIHERFTITASTLGQDMTNILEDMRILDSEKLAFEYAYSSLMLYFDELEKENGTRKVPEIEFLQVTPVVTGK